MTGDRAVTGHALDSVAPGAQARGETHKHMLENDQTNKWKYNKIGPVR